MSSLSLPRVLPQRKTSLEQERENFEKFQHVSISKAINSVECPVKEKHVRSAILGTYHEKSAETFWASALRLPLQENRIVAWKFCHVLHKVLREGHPHSVPSSLHHVHNIEELGKLWGHLKESYGRLIEHYSRLLVTKLEFHRRNPRIPGNLILSSSELDAVGAGDINNYFQLSVEMFDYMDDILTLQELIFGSLDMSKSNSMTSCGQCRLAPLIPCILDSSQLYDTCVKILFKLHSVLPPDLLAGHRQRFLKQFKLLSKFYQSASILQYFKNLISIPTLPPEPPNFLIESELASYVTPVVTVAEVVTDNLVDVSSPMNSHHTPSECSETSPDVISERDNLIEHLQNELARFRSEMGRLASENTSSMSLMTERILALENSVITKDSQLEDERRIKNEHISKFADLQLRYDETQNRLKVLEEKFQKLKELYTKLREEHIQLIRQKADVDRQLSAIRTSEADKEGERTRLEDLAQELAKLQLEADAAAEQNQALEVKLEFVQSEKNRVENEVQDLLSSKEELEATVTSLQKDAADLKAATEDIYREVVEECRRIVEAAVHEVDNPALSSSTCSTEYLMSLVSGVEKSFKDVESTASASSVIRLAHGIAQFVILGKAVSNTAPDIDLGDRLAEECRSLGEACVSLLNPEVLREPVRSASAATSKLSSVVSLVSDLIAAVKATGDAASVGDMVVSELAAMDAAIDEAAAKIEEMLSASRKTDTGIKLEVNEKILDSCTGLMQAIRILVEKSRLLQEEIVAQGKGSASVKEFYKRNHEWTEGLISAAKAVGSGAWYLVESADAVVAGRGKAEHVMVAAQGIAASTAQLVVASRVKATRGSDRLASLTVASRTVATATAGVVASAKHASDLVAIAGETEDLSKLTLHAARRLEMEAQVAVLELEANLQRQRLRLAALRRHHYNLEPDDAPLGNGTS